jgi:hypothetical protein
MLPALHVVFTKFGAAALREALQASGRNDAVVGFPDNLSFGPIDPADPKTRRRWVEKELGFTGWPSTPEDDGDNGWEDVPAKTRTFWNESLSPRYRKIAWVARRSAMEYAGFLEWLWRLGDPPCELIDLTEVKVFNRPRHASRRRLIFPMGADVLSADEIRTKNLWDLAEPLQISARRRYRDLWHRLRVENAPLRVINGGELVSAPITFVDPLLVSRAKANWLKVARVVGDVLHGQAMEGAFQTKDMVLAAPIGALVSHGLLEFQGESSFAMRFSEVRLPGPGN